MKTARLIVTALAVATIAAACGVAPPQATSSQPAIAIPQQAPQPITRTSPGAQIAWLSGPSGLAGYNAAGKQVASIGSSSTGVNYGFFRSADGAAIFTFGTEQISSHGTLDGKLIKTYQRLPGNVLQDAFSPDGRYLALILLSGPAYQLQVIDLRDGTSQTPPVAHDPNAMLPGMSGGDGSTGWAMPVFGPDSAHLYAVTGWGGPPRLTAFDLTSGKLRQLGTSADGQSASQLPGCAGPAMTMKVVGDGGTLVAFCHFDGRVWFLDLHTLGVSAVVDPHQGNPFWLSPIFTPDGQRLYLHQPPGFSDQMEMIDLVTRKLYGPVPTPQKLTDGGPFAGLSTAALAGGVASTAPISPDGLKLYSATADGVLVLRVPDLKPLAKLAAGVPCEEVWISGDGRTLFATSAGGKTLLVMHDDGSGFHAIPLADASYGFVASEHG